VSPPSGMYARLSWIVLSVSFSDYRREAVRRVQARKGMSPEAATSSAKVGDFADRPGARALGISRSHRKIRVGTSPRLTRAPVVALTPLRCLVVCGRPVGEARTSLRQAREQCDLGRWLVFFPG